MLSLATEGLSVLDPCSDAGHLFLFFFQMWIFRKVQNPTFTFFRRHVLQVLAKMLFLAKQAGMVHEGWVLWQLKLRCISQPAARYSLSNLWYGRGAVSLPFSPSKNPSLTRIYQGAQSYHPKVTVDALSVRRIFSHGHGFEFWHWKVGGCRKPSQRR